ncbi:MULTISPECIES: helix-turn-helix transcriptional regulator [unclassified Maridesulfovibrio]|uniref:helix-turn-helix transcriptional regulator n=1 Tax=unclassified Maridesulfovibrio TaxID=2794999 RepID=UPI003B40316B
MSIDKGYSSKQVMAVLGCGKTKFWEMVSNGEFPNKYHVGRKVMIPESDIEAYRERNQEREKEY